MDESIRKKEFVDIRTLWGGQQRQMHGPTRRLPAGGTIYCADYWVCLYIAL